MEQVNRCNLETGSIRGALDKFLQICGRLPWERRPNLWCLNGHRSVKGWTFQQWCPRRRVLQGKGGISFCLFMFSPSLCLFTMYIGIHRKMITPPSWLTYLSSQVVIVCVCVGGVLRTFKIYSHSKIQVYNRIFLGWTLKYFPTLNFIPLELYWDFKN